MQQIGNTINHYKKRYNIVKELMSLAVAIGQSFISTSPVIALE